MSHCEDTEHSRKLKTILSAALKDIRSRISLALAECDDPGRKVTLIAASKRQSAEKISMLAKMGHRDFGENYVQETLSKMDELHDHDIKWHFIGRLQTNKARHVAGRFALVHSVDSKKLAQGLHNKAKSLNIVQPVLIQVNLAGEIQKSGVRENDLMDLARSMLDMHHLRLDGLMIMPPLVKDPEESRPYFAQLKRLGTDLSHRLGISMPHLSMGMSSDLETAVKEGATLVRVGTLLMGQRPD